MNGEEFLLTNGTSQLAKSFVAHLLKSHFPDILSVDSLRPGCMNTVVTTPITSFLGAYFSKPVTKAFDVKKIVPVFFEFESLMWSLSRFPSTPAVQIVAMKTIEYEKESFSNQLLNLGVSGALVKKIVNEIESIDLLYYYSPLQHFRKYIDSLQLSEPEEFIDATFLDEASAENFRDFFRCFPGRISFSDWLFSQVSNNEMIDDPIIPTDRVVGVQFSMESIVSGQSLFDPKTIFGNEIGIDDFQILEQIQVRLPSLTANQCDLWYHACSLNSALHIIQNKIIVAKNSKFLDFGHLPSFYLTQNLMHAVLWAMKKFPSNPAILIFVVTEDQRNSFPLTMNLNNDMNQWRSVVKASRQESPIPIIATVDGCDWIYGKEAAIDVRESKRKDWIPEPGQGLFDQLAIKSSAAADLFYDCLQGLVFP